MLGGTLARGIEGGMGYSTCGRGKYKENGIKECLVTLSVRKDNDHIASVKGVTLELVVEDLGRLGPCVVGCV